MENKDKKITCYVFRCNNWYYLVKNFNYEDYEKNKENEENKKYDFIKSYEYIEKIKLESETFKKIKNGYGTFDSVGSVIIRGISSPFKDKNDEICEVKTLTENEYNNYKDQGQIIVLEQGEKEGQEQKNEIVIKIKESEEEKEESEEKKEKSEVAIDISGFLTLQINNPTTENKGEKKKEPLKEEQENKEEKSREEQKEDEVNIKIVAKNTNSSPSKKCCGCCCNIL